MKFVLTESKITRYVEKFFGNKIKSEKFNWVDKVEVELSATSFAGWKEDFPLYTYIVYFKDFIPPSYESQSELFDEISSFHSLIYGANSENRGFFSTKGVLTNGRNVGFPYFP